MVTAGMVVVTDSGRYAGRSRGGESGADVYVQRWSGRGSSGSALALLHLVLSSRFALPLCLSGSSAVVPNRGCQREGESEGGRAAPPDRFWAIGGAHEAAVDRSIGRSVSQASARSAQERDVHDSED